MHLKDYLLEFKNKTAKLIKFRTWPHIPHTENRFFILYEQSKNLTHTLCEYNLHVNILSKIRYRQ